MALTSYPEPKLTDSPCYFDNGRVAMWPSREERFTVSPSPCHNGGSRLEFHPYSFEKFQQRQMFGFLNGWYYGGGSTDRKKVMSGVHGNLSGILAVPWPVESNSIVLANAQEAARNRALSKLYNDIRSSEVNLSTTIGEGRETLEMMAAIARSVARPLDALTNLVKKPKYREYGLAKLSRRQQREWSKTKRRVKTSVLRTAGLTVSDLWLGWAVGLKPLLHDLESLSLHLKADKSLDIRYYKKARASEEVVEDLTSSDQDGGTYTFTRYTSYRSEFGAVYRVVDMHAFENWRLGLTVRPSLAWELTRLSFVVDYFVEIGTFLQTLEAALSGNGLEFDGGFETSSSLSQVNATYKRPEGDTSDGGSSTGEVWHVLGEGFATGYQRRTTKARTTLHSFPVSRAPTFKILTSGAQLLTVAALLSKFLS